MRERSRNEPRSERVSHRGIDEVSAGRISTNDIPRSICARYARRTSNRHAPAGNASVGKRQSRERPFQKLASPDRIESVRVDVDDLNRVASLN